MLTEFRYICFWPFWSAGVVPVRIENYNKNIESFKDETVLKYNNASLFDVYLICKVMVSLVSKFYTYLFMLFEKNTWRNNGLLIVIFPWYCN